jgi:hypothetical protein
VIKISNSQLGLRCINLNADTEKYEKQGNMTPPKVNNSMVTDTENGEEECPKNSKA